MANLISWKTAYRCQQANWKTPTGGNFLGQDKTRLELYFYTTHGEKDVKKKTTTCTYVRYIKSHLEDSWKAYLARRHCRLIHSIKGQWFCYICALCPWHIKSAKDAKQFMAWVPWDAKMDWSIWRCFCRTSC